MNCNSIHSASNTFLAAGSFRELVCKLCGIYGMPSTLEVIQRWSYWCFLIISALGGWWVSITKNGGGLHDA